MNDYDMNMGKRRKSAIIIARNVGYKNKTKDCTNEIQSESVPQQSCSIVVV